MTVLLWSLAGPSFVWGFAVFSLIVNLAALTPSYRALWEEP